MDPNIYAQCYAGMDKVTKSWGRVWHPVDHSSVPFLEQWRTDSQVLGERITQVRKIGILARRLQVWQVMHIESCSQQIMDRGRHHAGQCQASSPPPGKRWSRLANFCHVCQHDHIVNLCGLWWSDHTVQAKDIFNQMKSHVAQLHVGPVGVVKAISNEVL